MGKPEKARKLGVVCAGAEPPPSGGRARQKEVTEIMAWGEEMRELLPQFFRALEEDLQAYEESCSEIRARVRTINGCQYECKIGVVMTAVMTQSYEVSAARSAPAYAQ